MSDNTILNTCSCGKIFEGHIFDVECDSCAKESREMEIAECENTAESLGLDEFEEWEE